MFSPLGEVLEKHVLNLHAMRSDTTGTHTTDTCCARGCHTCFWRAVYITIMTYLSGTNVRFDSLIVFLYSYPQPQLRIPCTPIMLLMPSYNIDIFSFSHLSFTRKSRPSSSSSTSVLYKFVPLPCEVFTWCSSVNCVSENDVSSKPSKCGDIQGSWGKCRCHRSRICRSRNIHNRLRPF